MKFMTFTDEDYSNGVYRINMDEVTFTRYYKSNCKSYLEIFFGKGRKLTLRDELADVIHRHSIWK